MSSTRVTIISNYAIVSRPMPAHHRCVCHDIASSVCLIHAVYRSMVLVLFVLDNIAAVRLIMSGAASIMKLRRHEDPAG